MIRRALLLGVIAIFAAACAQVADQTRFGPPIDCATSKQGSLILIAQAVPNAEAIPCIETLPRGWSVIDIDITSDDVLVELRNTTFDTKLLMRLAPVCTGDGGPGRERRDVPVAGGACLTFTPNGEMDAAAIDALVASIGSIRRTDLAQATGWDL